MIEAVTEAASYAVAWFAFSVASGFIASRLPDRVLATEVSVTTGPGPTRPGPIYRWLRIDRWKDRLPEAGGFFAGGRSKSRLPDRSSESLREYVIETRRAEGVHWAGVVFGCTFFLWAPPLAAALNALFGLLAHLPFILVQRYNRRRVGALLHRRAERQTEVRPYRPTV